MTPTLQNRRPGRRVPSSRTALAVGLLLAAAACKQNMNPDVKPTTAQISVDGTAPVPLQLVVSTDFYEEYDQTSNQIYQIYNSSDTTFITPPYESTVTLTDLGSVVVTLTNFDDTPADVRMQVHLDSGQQPYDQRATMSKGGTLRYVFAYLPTIL